MSHPINIPDSSGIYTINIPQPALHGFRWEYALAHPDTFVRLLRGRKCSESNALFNECAAALQFPYYFGENWAALNDCLYDLVHAYPKIILLVDLADQHLAADEQGRMLFFDVMQSCTSFHQKRKGFFKLILQDTDTEMESLQAWLTENEVEFSPIMNS